MYPRQSGHYPFGSQQASQYTSQPAQYYEASNYYQGPPQQQPSQYPITQSSVVPQFHVFTQPVAVYTQYPYQQQQPPQPQPQQVQVSPDQIYYNRQTAPAAIVTTTPQPAQSKSISQLNQQPEQIVPHYHMMPPQQTQISANPTQQLIQQQGYVPQPLKKKDKSSYPPSSMMLNQLQSPSVYQQQPNQMQMQVPVRPVSNIQTSNQMPIKQQYQQQNQTQNSEGQSSSTYKQQFHFDQNEPPGCFDIIGRGNLPSVVFESDVQLM